MTLDRQLITSLLRETGLASTLAFPLITSSEFSLQIRPMTFHADPIGVDPGSKENGRQGDADHQGFESPPQTPHGLVLHST